MTSSVLFGLECKWFKLLIILSKFCDHELAGRDSVFIWDYTSPSIFIDFELSFCFFLNFFSKIGDHSPSWKELLIFQGHAILTSWRQLIILQSTFGDENLTTVIKIEWLRLPFRKLSLSHPWDWCKKCQVRKTCS